MPDDRLPPDETDPQRQDARKALPPAAQRALAEAEARRAARPDRGAPASPEIAGRGGLDPVRYDDWEIEGRAVDF